MSTRRFVSGILVVAFVAAYPLAPLAFAQTSPPAAESNDHAVAAGFANVVYVPGKALTCVFGTAVSAGIMLVTFGALYQDAAKFVQGSCGGKWRVEGRDIGEALTHNP